MWQSRAANPRIFVSEKPAMPPEPGGKSRSGKVRSGRSGPSHARAGAPGLAARRVAAEALRRAIRERRTLDEALQLASGPARLDEADFGLARAIATIAFRRMGTIRAAITARLDSGRMPDAGTLEETVITGAAQLLFMEVPDHAAVDIAVELAKADRKALHYASLVNALLRRIARDRTEILAASDPFANDTPGWIAERWSRAYGEDAARAIAAVHATPPHIDLTATVDAQALAEAVGGRLMPTGSVRLTTDAAVRDLPGFAEGAFFVQDAASALPARLIGAQAGQNVLDLCAAPGGKTAQLAQAGARVTAVERSADRGRRLSENLARLRLEAELVIGDAGAFTGGPYDAVLLDAPCSATGTIRRHPEIAWTKRLEDILALGVQQARLLAHAASLVKPGGVLVYSTCSLEPEEGERQISRFLATSQDYAIEPVKPEELGIAAESVTPEGFLRVLPSHFADWGGGDGFFAARLRRAR
jgi:16S rRNA (cytosine967-C5)-methyltransferase